VRVPTNLSTAWYLAQFGSMARWHRFEVEGLDTLLKGPACMIVGYHGRPLAWDLLMLGTVIYEHKGYLPHGLVHTALSHGPVGALIRSVGFVFSDGPELEGAIARGEHMLVAPGSIQEGCRSARQRYAVSWPDKFGYLRLALRYGLPVVPVAADGADDLYVGLNDGGTWGKALHMPFGLPLWLGVGPLGLWPLSPSWPVKVRQRIGAPIDLGARGLTADDKDGLLAMHRELAGVVQGMLDTLRANR